MNSTTCPQCGDKYKNKHDIAFIQHLIKTTRDRAPKHYCIHCLYEQVGFKEFTELADRYKYLITSWLIPQDKRSPQHNKSY